ncbi:MAG TPA: hypothetical protein VHX65_16265 [Pirellulales bacterium]|nr:hypothetical protein [Pirellulales bacterium]
MGNSNRTALLTKAHRILKQHYTPIGVPLERPLLEHLLFALVLENAPFDAAEKIYTHLSKNFFDWNEVRVSTVMELSEVARPLPDPGATASNIKRVLQGVFESTYSFDLEPVKKQNISAAIKQLERLGGTTPFSLAYVTQVALGGHAIPLDRGALDVLAVLGIISEGEAESGRVSGLERVIPKNKGLEFGSLLHQLAAEYVANPFSPAVRKLLLSINPDAKDRFPKRREKKDDAHEEAHSAAHHAGAPATGDHGAKKHAIDGRAKHAAEKAAGEKVSGKEAASKPAAGKETEKSAEKIPAKSAAKPAEKPRRTAEKTERAVTKKSAPAAGKPSEGKPSEGKHSEGKHSEGKHSEGKPSEGKHSESKHADHKHGETKHRPAAKPHPVAAKPKSASKQLSKRKPR